MYIIYKDVIITSITPRGVQNCKGVEFYMQLNLSWYQFKIDCYNIIFYNYNSIVTTKRISVEYTYTQKNEKGIKSVTIKS